MKNVTCWARFWTLLACGLSSLVSAADDRTLLESFARHVRELKHPQADSIVASLEQAADSADAITESLRVLYPEYSAGVTASDDDNLELARQQLLRFSTSDDKFLAADAKFYLARTLMNHERFEEAMPLLLELQGPLTEYSTQSAVVQYYIGQSLAGLLQNEEAVAALMDFLQMNPDAPERLRVSAWRKVQELQAIQPGKMQDVYHRMDYSRRRLKIVEAGDKTQDEQNKIVSMLAKLIQEQEKKECSNCNSKKNANQQQQAKNHQQAKSEPKQSQSQSGGNSNNPNGKFVEKSFDTGNASPWSRLRGMERDPANAGIKDKLPARYKEIVERYNDAVNGNAGKSADDQ